MGKQTIKIADKPTLDEVKEGMGNISERLSSVVPEYTIGDCLSIDNIESNTLAMGVRQNIIVAGDYIVKFIAIDVNYSSGRIPYVTSASGPSNFIARIYNTKTRRQSDVYMSTTSSSLAVETMKFMYNFYMMLRSTPYYYLYDSDTNEVFMYSIMYGYSSNYYKAYCYVARFKVVDDTFTLISCKVKQANKTIYSSNGTSSSYFSSAPLYVPSLGKIFSISYGVPSSGNYFVLQYFDVSNFLLNGDDIDTDTMWDAYTKDITDLGNSVSCGRLVYDKTRNRIYARQPSVTHPSNMSIPTVTITLKTFIFNLSEDNTSATFSYSTSNTSIDYSKLSPANNARLYSNAKGVGQVTTRDSPIWYNKHMYVICNERLYKMLPFSNITSDEIIKFPFTPQAWKLDGDMLTLYALDENDYLLEYKYDMSSMVVRCDIDDLMFGNDGIVNESGIFY